MKTIYLLYGETCYESDDLIRCYASKIAADTEAARLNEILKARPRCTLSDPDFSWEAYNEQENAWNDAMGDHPKNCDQFNVREIELQEGGEA
jgi:hypothetical protein